MMIVIFKNSKNLLLPVVLILFIANVLSILFVVGKDGKVKNLNYQIEQITKTNQEIRDQLVAKSSFSGLAEKAQSSEFIKSDYKINLDSGSSVALSR